MSQFIIIDVDDRLRPAPPKSGEICFVGKHAYQKSKILFLFVEDIAGDTRVIIGMQELENFITLWTKATPAAIMAQLQSP